MNLLEGRKTRLGGLNLRDFAWTWVAFPVYVIIDVSRGDDPLDHCQCSSQLTQISSYVSKVSLQYVIIKSLTLNNSFLANNPSISIYIDFHQILLKANVERITIPSRLQY